MFGKRIQSLEDHIRDLKAKLAAAEKRGNRWKTASNTHKELAVAAVTAFDEAMVMYHQDMSGVGPWHGDEGYGPLRDAYLRFKAAGLVG